MLEDLPVPGWLLILAFGELNEAPKRSSDSEESAIRDFTVCRYPLCVSLADTNVAIKITSNYWPDKNYVVW